MSERKFAAEHAYSVLLPLMYQAVGTDDLTTDSQLRAAMKSLFPGRHTVVGTKFAPLERDGYYILNLMEAPGGSHWVAVVVDQGRRYFYDSFARTAKELLGGGFEDAELDAEQGLEENNCGQRCLAWLWLYEHMGWEYARWI